MWIALVTDHKAVKLAANVRDALDGLSTNRTHCWLENTVAKGNRVEAVYIQSYADNQQSPAGAMAPRSLSRQPCQPRKSWRASRGIRPVVARF